MVINSPCLIHKKELAIPGQTATGKEFPNPLMAGSLPKTISTKLQALVDGKKVIITETSVRRVLKFKDAEGIECLPNADIFAQLTLMGDIPLFPTMIVQAQEQVDAGLEIPTASHHTPTNTQPSTSKPQKKQSRRKQRKDTEDPQLSGPTHLVTDDTKNMASVPTHSIDPLLSGEDRLKLKELMELCISLSQRVLDLEKTKTFQTAKITELKERVKKLEMKGGSITHRLRRLYKVGRSARVVSFDDEGLGDQEDASKQGRKIVDIDADTKVTLVDDIVETQGRFNDDLMFDTDVLDEQEVEVEKEVSTADPVTTAGKVVTTANVEVTTESATITTIDELTLAQTLIEIKAAKPKVRGVMIQEPTELEEEERLAKPREEDANIAEWDDVQAMMDADYELATRLQAEEQGELTIEEKSKMFVELMDKRKKHFARLRAEEQRRKLLTKAQKRNQMCSYLKNMAGYKQSKLKNKSFAKIQKLFDKAMTRVNMFVDIDIELVKESSNKAEVEMAQESSSKRAGKELE
ncbi:hypothetical protein Tco_0017671 [Tanacetum coccineum]